MANNLLDMLQSMSNAASDTVAAPVDGLAWLLRKAGLPIAENPFLSTKWQEEAGLRRPVQQGAAQVVGDTLGLLTPTAASKYAPQIAQGLLQAGQNLRAPTQAGQAAAQRGAIVWHGSPHKFDVFDASKIGTGEGAQAYGHGLYLADSPDVAGSYIQAGRNVGFENWDDPIRLANKAFGNANGNKEAAIALLDEAINAAKPGSRKNNLIFAKQALARGDQTAGIYKVDLPDPVIARMLDWDKPLSQQALPRSLVNKIGSHPDNLRTMPANPTGQELVQAMQRYFRNTTSGSDELRRAGIPGIRYLDGGSRAAGQGSSNYVVFPGEEEVLRILERNGVPLR